MSNALDQSKIKTRKGKAVFGCLFLGILWVFPSILYLANIMHGNFNERLAANLVGIVGLLVILGSIILLVKTRYVSYGLWCNKCNMFVNRKWNRCSICRNKKLSWKRLPR